MSPILFKPLSIWVFCSMQPTQCLNDTKHVSVMSGLLEFCVSVARKPLGILLGPDHMRCRGPLLSTNPAGQVVLKCLCPSQKNVDSNSLKNLKEGEDRATFKRNAILDIWPLLYLLCKWV